MRCYDGCPDKELQAIIDDYAAAKKELAAQGMRATYFPMEGAWMVFRNLESVTGFCSTIRDCANEVQRARNRRKIL